MVPAPFALERIEEAFIFEGFVGSGGWLHLAIEPITIGLVSQVSTGEAALSFYCGIDLIHPSLERATVLVIDAHFHFQFSERDLET